MNKIIDEWSQFDPRLEKVFMDKGYQYISAGSDQQVWMDPKQDKVLKVFGSKMALGPNELSKDQKMALLWCKFCHKNSDNPFLPKFYGIKRFVFNAHPYLLIEQETLSEIDKTVGFSMTKYANVCSDADVTSPLAAYYRYIDENAHYSGELNKVIGIEGMKELGATLFALYHMGKDHGWMWDMHQYNFMVRQNSFPVIIDPWCLE